MNRLRQALANENTALEYTLVAITGLLAGSMMRADLNLLWRTIRLIFPV